MFSSSKWRESSPMNCSERFLNLLQQQLTSFQADPEVDQLVVYVARSNDGGSPSLEVVGQWPESEQQLPPVETDPNLRTPSSDRRWYPLQEGSILLGVIRVEMVASCKDWPISLDQRLQATAAALASSLNLELERDRLLDQLGNQKEQIALMVHQLRNPLTALGTYAKLLLRKLGPESEHRNLVEGLLNEQAQVNKYLSALDQLSQIQLPSVMEGLNRFLLPPVLPNEDEITLKTLLEPLIDRAEVTANLQSRKWQAPSQWPLWTLKKSSNKDGAIAEIIANLLENAFKYSPRLSSLGLEINERGICIWDTGDKINIKEREKIFEKGYRSKISLKSSGSGLGLALGRELARQIGGDIKLFETPIAFKPSLPKEGNAFVFIRDQG